MCRHPNHVLLPEMPMHMTKLLARLAAQMNMCRSWWMPCQLANMISEVYLGCEGQIHAGKHFASMMPGSIMEMRQPHPWNCGISRPGRPCLCGRQPNCSHMLAWRALAVGVRQLKGLVHTAHVANMLGHGRAQYKGSQGMQYVLQLNTIAIAVSRHTTPQGAGGMRH